jgi:hypothetical protein
VLRSGRRQRSITLLLAVTRRMVVILFLIAIRRRCTQEPGRPCPPALLEHVYCGQIGSGATHDARRAAILRRRVSQPPETGGTVTHLAKNNIESAARARERAHARPVSHACTPTHLRTHQHKHSQAHSWAPRAFFG